MHYIPIYKFKVSKLKYNKVSFKGSNAYHNNSLSIPIYYNLTKKEQNIPYRSITDFVLKRGPFDRYLGIGTIQVQTAG